MSRSSRKEKRNTGADKVSVFFWNKVCSENTAEL
nr:MAG TPA: hypothetical protein [Bacteriophage sp.]